MTTYHGGLTSGRLVLPADAPREPWLAARRAGITATDLVKIMCPGRYGTAMTVWLDKRLGEQDTPDEAAEWGRILEDPIAREWARRHGARVRRIGLMRHRDHPHHLAACDRDIVGGGGLLECKARTRWAADEWAGGAIPDRVTVQAQWQMHVTGRQPVHVAALIGGNELVEATVAYDEALVALLVDEADRMWAAVQSPTPPQLPAWQLTAESLDRAYPDRAGVVDVDPAVAGPLIQEYEAASDLEGYVESAKEHAKLQLLALLGDAQEATIIGRPAYSWRTSSKTSVPAANVRRLIAEHPRLAKRYVVTTTSRRFHLEGT